MILKTIIRLTNSVIELLTLYVTLNLIAAGLIGYFEGWDLPRALYLAFQSSPTLGYGDTPPLTWGGKITALTLVNICLFLVLPLAVGRIYAVMTEDKHQFTDEEQKQLLADVEWIRNRLR